MTRTPSHLFFFCRLGFTSIIFDHTAESIPVSGANTMILELSPRPTSLHPPSPSSHKHVTQACGKIGGVRFKFQMPRKNVQLGISGGEAGLAIPFGVAQQRKKKEWHYHCRAGSSSVGDDESAHLCLFPLQ